jgi:hypothetical protein
MPVIRLGDVDRERYGGPEWLEVPDTLPMREAEALEEAGGAYLDWFRRHTARGFATVVWVGLHRAGVTLKWSELADLDLGSILIADADPGKAVEASDNGASHTPRTSASSSDARRKRSSG